MIPEYLNFIYAEIEKSKSFGFRLLSNGTKLYGHVPHIAPEAWFHRIYAPLSEIDVLKLEELLNITFSDPIREFYMFNNGLNIFSNAISIYGLRYNFSRTGDNAFQPFDIVSTNIYERPKSIKDLFLIIGGYSEDGSKVLCHLQTHEIYRFSLTNPNHLNKWDNFEDFLIKEFKRLSLIFDNEGKLSPQLPQD